MLQPDYFNGKSDRMIELYEELQTFILKDITRRLLSAGEMTATADRLIYRLKLMGESQAEIERKIRQISGLTRKELRALLQDAVLTSWNDDFDTLKQVGAELSNPLENSVVMRIMDAEYKKCLGELNNLTRTTMLQSNKDLLNMLNEAEMRVSSGVQSYSAAIYDVLDRYAAQGMMIAYPSGAMRTLEAAVRCAVVTSMNQTAAAVSLEYVKEAKTNLVLVSAHLGARTAQKGRPPYADHSAWQGKVYYIKDKDLERLTNASQFQKAK